MSSDFISTFGTTGSSAEDPAAGRSQRIQTICRAQREAVAWEMAHNDRIFMLGEDVYRMGGVFGTADGLGAKYGPSRVMDMPISETGFIGLATGAAMEGMHPIVELAYVDFTGVCFNAIVNYAAKTHYMSGGQRSVPMVLITGTGGGYNNAAQHSQCLHALFAHMPGIKVVCPSTAFDAKGLMHSALRDNNFVIYMIHKGTSGVAWMGTPLKTTLSEVPFEPYEIPFGEVRVHREGTDVTIVGVGMSVHQALIAAVDLAAEGISVEVVDLRTLVPLDREGVIRSVRKTGRLLVADEDYRSFGVSGEIITSVVERDPRMLRAAPQRICMPDVPYPYSRALESHVLPLAPRIVAAVRTMVAAS